MCVSIARHVIRFVAFCYSRSSQENSKSDGNGVKIDLPAPKIIPVMVAIPGEPARTDQLIFLGVKR